MKSSVARSVVFAGLLAQAVNIGYLLVRSLGLIGALKLFVTPGPELVLAIAWLLCLAFALPVAKGKGWAAIASMVTQVLVVLLFMPPFIFWFGKPHGFVDWATFTGAFTIAFVVIGYGVVAFREARGKVEPAAFSVSSRQTRVLTAIGSGVAGMLLLAAAVAMEPKAEAALTEAPENMIAVTINGMTYEPAAWQLEAGKATAIFLTNNTEIPHDLVIDELGVKTSVEAGTTGVVIVKPEKAGTIHFYCSLDGHQQNGMHGTIEVK